MNELFSDDEVGPAEPMPRGGYAARPGSGPDGRTCQTCGHFRHVRFGQKFYTKCALVKRQWTRGTGTDIKASVDACRWWESHDTRGGDANE